MNMLLYQKLFVLSFLALFIACLCHSSAIPFIVGDSSGWVIPPYPSYYSNWAHSHVMRVGDSLEFHFYPKFYNLVQVRQDDYDHCTTLEPVKIFNNSPAIIPLKEKGNLFFTCTISNYCSLGQKVAITVHENIPPCSPLPPLPTPSPPPPPPPTPTPSPPPLPTPSISPVPPPNTPTPVPESSNQGDKSSAVTLVYRTSTFNVSMWKLLSLFGSFLGFWII
ncbi:PREDICTED: cucumber peeling cupredoxin-like [Lupinus angustifolius]|uniref:cucumber peeling cupredoxin-like n=1 Tax=Lupinus angustifolius TaxID=3871 RepID=UPI00092E6716|nr:PREDICTED: cucumber peeling cupredoxin-like [Lupinus angustifolius]